MLKLIYKNIIAHRRRYIWILLELCLATFIFWSLLDKVIVNEYNRFSPSGFDIERLAVFSFKELPASAMPQGFEPREIDDQMADVTRILDLIRSDSRVEAATISSSHFCFEMGGININSVPNSVQNEDGSEKESEFLHSLYVNFWRGTDFFKTFGLKDASGAELKDFDEQPMSKSELIVSRSIADFLFPGENPIGRNLFEKSTKYNPEDNHNTIVGVVNDASYRRIYDRTPIIYRPRNNKDVERSRGIKSLNGVIRLKDGVNMGQFIRDYSPKIEEEYRFGEVCCQSLRPYTDERDMMSRDIDNEHFISKSIAIFFLVNIMLCMTGTFYLQTRQRSTDVGVMRSFGATRGFVLREMLGEGFVMVTLTWLIGCGLYWFFIRDHGLASLSINVFSGIQNEPMLRLIPRWYDDFNTHFSIVSLIIYVILLISVIIGIYFPARKISKINPVDALRDE